jgi:response regulator RpfG family c-di-GMP phosphodiesterase
MIDTVEQAPEASKGTLLFVDDERNILSSLKRLFRPKGYHILLAESGAEGLAILEREAVDVIVSDMRMPEMDGAAFLQQAAQRWPHIARLLLTGYADLQSTVAAVNQGRIYAYINKPWDDADLIFKVDSALERKRLEEERARLLELTRSQNDELQALNVNLEQKVKERTEDLGQAMASLEVAHESLKRSYTASVKVFANLIELRERKAAGHAQRVAELGHKLATQLGLKRSEVQDVLFAGLLHDIGKIGLPDALVNKPFNSLEQGERLQVLKHPVIGEGVLMSLEPLQGTARIIRSHHEQWDGRGYPDGLGGNDIPIGARILAVANDFDALQTGTLWTKRMTAAEAREYIVRNKAKLYDTKVVEVFLALDESALQEPRRGGEIALKSNGLRPGQVLARDLLTEEGVLLLAGGHVLDEQLITSIQRMEEKLDCSFVVYIETRKGKV